MRLLVTGSQGQVARSLAALRNDAVEVVAAGRPELDITSRSSVERAIAAHRPDVVVNAAAYTAVDRAEAEIEAAFAVNRDGAGNVARAAAESGLPVIHLSTDYVFSGDKPSPYLETDATGPLGVYGASKLAGEAMVAEANAAHAILRTAWVYGSCGQNFLKTMLRLAAERCEVRVVADQFGAPTHADDIAAGIVVVARRMVDDPKSEAWRGLFHMVAAGETSWAEFAAEIFTRSAERGGPSAVVAKIATADYPTAARRPANSRLDTARFAAAFNHRLPEWEDGVGRCLADLAAAT